MLRGRSTQSAEKPQHTDPKSSRRVSKWRPSLRSIKDVRSLLLGKKTFQKSESKPGINGIFSISSPLENPMLQALDGHLGPSTGRGDETIPLNPYLRPHTVHLSGGQEERRGSSWKGFGLLRQSLRWSKATNGLSTLDEPQPQTPNIRVVPYKKPVRSTSSVNRPMPRSESRNREMVAQRPAITISGLQNQRASGSRRDSTKKNSRNGLEPAINPRYPMQNGGQPREISLGKGRLLGQHARAQRPATSAGVYRPQHAAADFSKMNLQPKYNRNYSSANWINAPQGGRSTQARRPATATQTPQHLVADFYQVNFQPKYNSHYNPDHWAIGAQPEQQAHTRMPSALVQPSQHPAADFYKTDLQVRHSRNCTWDHRTTPLEHHQPFAVQPAAVEADSRFTNYQNFLKDSKLAAKKKRNSYVSQRESIQPQNQTSEIIGEIEANYREALKEKVISIPQRTRSKRLSKSGSFFEPVLDYIKPYDPGEGYVHLIDNPSTGENVDRRPTTADERQGKRRSLIAEYVKPRDMGDKNTPSRKYPPVVDRGRIRRDQSTNSEERQRNRHSWALEYTNPINADSTSRIERQRSGSRPAGRGTSEDRQRKRRSWVAEYIKPSVEGNPQTGHFSVTKDINIHEKQAKRWSMMSVDSSRDRDWDDRAARASWTTFGNGTTEAMPAFAGLSNHNYPLRNRIV